MSVYEVVHTNTYPVIKDTESGRTYSVYEVTRLLDYLDTQVREMTNDLKATNTKLKEINDRLEGLNACW